MAPQYSRIRLAFDASACAGRPAVPPFIGIGCPGIIRKDGSIARGGQNLPGNGHSTRFHLPERIFAEIPEIGGNPTAMVMHNDQSCRA